MKSSSMISLLVFVPAAAAVHAQSDTTGDSTITSEARKRMLRWEYADRSNESIAFENLLRGLGEDADYICSPRGEKSEFCGGQPRPGRGKFCCDGLRCGGGGKNKYCVVDDEEDGGGDKSICSVEGQKAVACNAKPREGRGKKCCGELVCGGEKNKFCVKPDYDNGDEEEQEKQEEQEEQEEQNDQVQQEDEDDDDDKGDDVKGKDDSKREGYEAPPIDRSGDKSLGFLWHLYYEPGIKVR